MANLVETLLKADTDKFKELKTGTFKSPYLAEKLGAKEPVEVKIKQLPMKRFKEIGASTINKNGDYDSSRTYNSQLLLIVAGVTDPPLTDKELQAHFGTATPKDLAEILFGTDIDALSVAISDLCTGESEEEDEDEIKN